MYSETPPWLSPEVNAARDKVGAAIREYISLIRPDDDPFVVVWAVGVEWTNAELEQNGHAGRDTISPTEQSLAAMGGMGVYLTARAGL